MFKKNQKYLAIINNRYITENKVSEIYQNNYLKKEIFLKYKFTQIFKNKSYIKQMHLEILSQIINTILIKNYIDTSKYEIKNDLLKKIIFKMPVFQTSNTFNEKKYLNVLNNINVSPLKYESSLKNQLTIFKLLKNIKKNEFTLKNELSSLTNNISQIRIIDKIKIPIKNILIKKNFTKQEIIQFYIKHNSHFFKPESFKIAFIKITPQSLYNYNYFKPTKNYCNTYILHNKKENTKEKQIHTITNTILTQRKTFKIYHNLQKKINKQIYSNNVTLHFFQKKIKHPIFITRWFTDKNMPYECKLNQIKSILFSKNSMLNKNTLKKHSQFFIMNNNSFFIIKIIGYKNKTKKNIKNSRKEILYSLKFNKSKQKITTNIQTILIYFHKKNKKYLQNLGIDSFEKNIPFKHSKSPITNLIFLLPAPKKNTFTYNIFNDIKGNFNLLILSKINKTNLPNSQKNSVHIFESNKILKKLLKKLYKKSYILYKKI